MTDQHPITPPPQLVEQWRTTPEHVNGRSKIVLVSMTTSKLQEIADCAARWGADQELEACCEWLRNNGLFETRIGHLRDARRPKVPTLKEKVLDILGSHGDLSPEEHSRIADILEDSLRD